MDCDELLYCTQQLFGAVLADIARDRVTAVIRPAENTVQDGPRAMHHFRLPMTVEQREITYGDKAPLMEKRAGLIGHLFGKLCHRTGHSGLVVGEHNAQFQGHKTRTPNRKFDASTGVYLLHFNGADYDIWRDRVEFRADGASFPPALTLEIKRILQLETGREEALRDLHSAINVFDAAARQQMQEAGCGMTLELDFDALIAKYFPQAVGSVV